MKSLSARNREDLTRDRDEAVNPMGGTATTRNLMRRTTCGSARTFSRSWASLTAAKMAKYANALGHHTKHTLHAFTASTAMSSQTPDGPVQGTERKRAHAL